jgi:hypothetical protein
MMQDMWKQAREDDKKRRAEKAKKHAEDFCVSVESALGARDGGSVEEPYAHFIQLQSSDCRQEPACAW